MPKIFEWNGYKFFFYPNEGSPIEPRHVHVRKGGRVAKFWIDPDVAVASSYQLSSGELTDIKHVIEDKRELKEPME